RLLGQVLDQVRLLQALEQKAAHRAVIALRQLVERMAIACRAAANQLSIVLRRIGGRQALWLHRGSGLPRSRGAVPILFQPRPSSTCKGWLFPTCSRRLATGSTRVSRNFSAQAQRYRVKRLHEHLLPRVQTLSVEVVPSGRCRLHRSIQKGLRGEEAN